MSPTAIDIQTVELHAAKTEGIMKYLKLIPGGTDNDGFALMGDQLFQLGSPVRVGGKVVHVILHG
jgi:hypothetical protein